MVNRFLLKAALRDLDEKGIRVGDVVTVTWDVDEAYAVNGERTLSQTGPLALLDRETGWFEISPTTRSPGHLRSSITAMGTRMVKLEKRNPFIDKASRGA
jgi:hypothetical protein